MRTHAKGRRQARGAGAKQPPLHYCPVDTCRYHSSRWFASYRSLRRHFARSHVELLGPNPPSFACGNQGCHRTFTLQADQEAHTRRCANAHMRWSCAHVACTSNFATRNSAAEHGRRTGQGHGVGVLFDSRVNKAQQLSSSESRRSRGSGGGGGAAARVVGSRDAAVAHRCAASANDARSERGGRHQAEAAAATVATAAANAAVSSASPSGPSSSRRVPSVTTGSSAPAVAASVIRQASAKLET